MLLVSLPETEGEGEEVRTSSASLMLGEDASGAGVSITGMSWRTDKNNLKY